MKDMHRRLRRILSLATVLSVLALLLIPAGTALAQTATLTPTSGQVGSGVSFTGTGHTANAAFNVYFAYGNTTYQSIVFPGGTVSASGTASGSFNVPQIPSATYIVRIATSTTAADTSFTVMPAMTLSATSSQVGTQITVTGTGYGASRGVTILFDGSTITSTSTNIYGTFGVSFNVPASTAGAHTIIATDGIRSLSTTLTVMQTVVISPTSGTPGTTVTVTGSGFSASLGVTITYAGLVVNTVPASVATNSVGSFSATFSVPAGLGRTAQIVATDGIYSASATFTLVAGITLTPTTGSVGTQVNVAGTGFDAVRQVNVSFASALLVQPTTTSAGAFSVSFSVPVSTGGQHTVTATDGTNVATAVFTTQASLNISPNTGRIGTSVTVTGAGFGASRQVSIQFRGGQVASVTADANGSFSAAFGIPASPGGNHPVTAGDGTNSASQTFAVVSHLTLSPASGIVGEQVTVSGTGFGATRTVSIRFGTTQVKATATDANGNFTDRFVVPQLDAGSYTVTAADGVNTATAAFTITTSFRIDPTTGAIGSSVTVRGTGFQGTVTVRYDNSTVATAVAEASGAFSVSFAVPASVRGEHTVTVSDAAVSLKTTFNVESTPPPVPTLLTPQSGARQNAQPTLSWQGVSDPSGVTYSLQIASDASFASIVLQKQGLTTTQYSLTQAEKLVATNQDAPYYWRVRAIDLASNQSDWSAPGSFYVSFLADWLKYTLIIIGALIAALLIFWLGMLTGRGQRTKAVESNPLPPVDSSDEVSKPQNGVAE